MCGKKKGQNRQLHKKGSSRVLIEACSKQGQAGGGVNRLRAGVYLAEKFGKAAGEFKASIKIIISDI